MFTHIKSKYFTEENRLDLGSDRLYIPKIMLSNKNKNRTFNLEMSRNERLLNPSEQETKFIQLFPEFIQELPLPITDLRLWNEILDPYRISRYDRERTRNIHQVDFVHPESSLGIELDSESHKLRKMLDQARDEYLKLEYGITIMRFENNMEFLNHLDEIRQAMNVYNPLQIINLRYLSDEYFERKFKVVITSIEIIMAKRDDWKIPRLRGIILTKNDMKDLMITDKEFPLINEWSTKYCGKELIKINVNGNTKDIIHSYRNGEINPKDNLYKILKNLGY